MKKSLIIMVLALAMSLGLTFGSSASAAPYCGITWGSLPKTATDKGVGEYVQNVRTGRNTCYDRMVVDLSAANKSGYTVRYVSNVYADGSGQLVPLAGGAKLQITLTSPSYNSNNVPTYGGVVGSRLPGVNLTGYQTFREAKFAGSYEGYTDLGLGVRAKLPFRVFTLDKRVIIDVAHKW